MTKEYGVYRIVSPNGSVYIGMTVRSFEERWSDHKRAFKSGNVRCSGLNRAFEKYGVEKMSFEILEDLTGEDELKVLSREKHWWLLHKPWVNIYNGQPSGSGSVLHTEETRRKIGKSLRESTKNQLLYEPYDLLENNISLVRELADDVKVNMEEASSRLGVKKSQLKRFCSNNNIKFITKRTESLLVEKALNDNPVKAWYLEDKLTTREIAKKLNISQPLVVRYLNKIKDSDSRFSEMKERKGMR